MAATVPVEAARRHLLPSEMRPTMAKADLRKSENVDLRAVAGHCLDMARLALGWNLDQLADGLGRRDPRQIARWISGAERLQLDAVIAVPELHAAFVIALAGLSNSIEITTTIAIRRHA